MNSKTLVKNILYRADVDGSSGRKRRKRSWMNGMKNFLNDERVLRKRESV